MQVWTRTQATDERTRSATEPLRPEPGVALVAERGRPAVIDRATIEPIRGLAVSRKPPPFPAGSTELADCPKVEASDTRTLPSEKLDDRKN
jgi:hypothetical protein